MNENQSSIRDNRSRGSVGRFLRDNANADAALSIVSAYFTPSAYWLLKEQLNNIGGLRFLFGEPTFVQSLNADKSRQSFGIADDGIALESCLRQKAEARECAAWLAKCAEIRSMVKPNFLHGKLYHIQNANGVCEAVTGSSNFTVNGLGLGGSPNIELNLVVNDRRDLNELKSWFDEVWNDATGLVTDVKAEVLNYLAKLYSENSPETVYFKTLFHLFGEYLEQQRAANLLDERADLRDSEIWNYLYEFQKDGVKAAINKILKHGGCIIADSVGLGKTFEALAVIKYFNSLSNNSNALVLCPKKLAANWTIYQAKKNNLLNQFPNDRFNFDVLYHTDLGRTTGATEADGFDLANFNWGVYDLVVIDESHNFRGNPVEKQRDDGTIRQNRARWLMEKIIKSGAKTKVLLLSATPVNNDLRDLRNQILLMTEGDNTALFDKTGIKNISTTLDVAQKQFTAWADRKKNPVRTTAQLLEKLDSSVFKLLDELTIARSRQHVETFYDTAAIGKFPTRRKPVAVYPDVDTQNRFLTFDYLNQQISEYKLVIFNPSAYVKANKRKDYEEQGANKLFGFKQSQREYFLIGMMKVNFLKRLESSIESFEISMHKTIEKIERLQDKIRKFQINRQTAGELDLFSFEPDDNELEEAADDGEQWQVGKKLKFNLADLRLDDWLRDLERDRTALIQLYNNAVAITPERDAKLAELKRLVRQKINEPLNAGNKKVLVFTAFSDTAEYLYEQLKDFAEKELNVKIALVTGTATKTTFGKNDFGSILTNFSPVSKGRDKRLQMPQNEEIDLLIATDCISEGQNLQDCDYLINYDIHWNPVRIIQRFGRIDRLGSRNKQIQLVNFWVTKDLDNYLNLKERVEARMALVDVTATGDDNLLNSAAEVETSIENELRFRDEQLKRLKEEVLDLEEMSESVSLTDFTLDDFRLDLDGFLNLDRENLRQMPLGLYAVVPAPGGEFADPKQKFSQAEKDIVQPGIIFCLKQKGATKDTEAVNPLQPYFLVYVRADGTVRYNYTNAKQILEIYRLLCQNRREPYEKLCEMFNRETDGGAQMRRETELLKKAVAEIAQVFRKRGNQKLTTDRSALIVPQSAQINDISDFELITWLIIK